MGFSDVTTLTAYVNQRGLVAFNSPMVMAGFSQIDSLPPSFTEHIRQMLFGFEPPYEYATFDFYSEGFRAGRLFKVSFWRMRKGARMVERDRVLA